MIGWLRRNTLCRLNRHRWRVFGAHHVNEVGYRWIPSELSEVMAVCRDCGVNPYPRVNPQLYAHDYAIGPWVTGLHGRRKALVLRAAGL